MKDIVPETLEEALKVIEKAKTGTPEKRIGNTKATGRNNQSTCRN